MFKNIRIFKIGDDWVAPDASALEAALQASPFEPCGPTQEEAAGWSAPRPVEFSPFVEVIDGQWIMKLQIERKSVPGNVIKAEVDKRCKAIESQTGRAPSRKEKKELKEDVRLELLPRAFSKRSAVTVWLDPENKTLVLDTTSSSLSDVLIDYIVTAFAKAEAVLPIRLLNTAMSPSAAMTHWLMSGEAPHNFSVDRDLELKQADESQATVRYSHHNLEGDDIRAHITSGKIPTLLGLTWSGRVSFLLNSDLTLKKIELLDDVFVDAPDGADFDGDVVLHTGELAKVIPDLVEALGGEAPFGEADVAETAQNAGADPLPA